MNYDRLKRAISERLEETHKRQSERASAELVNMSQKGYASMIKNHTLTVKKLEEIAMIVEKPVSYFLLSDKDPDTNTVEEPYMLLERSCQECKKKEDKINELISELKELQSELLDLYREKRKSKNCE